ncbi:MAG: hypothetical protein PHD74_00680 [Candidatus Krumholzibacteria bacterium]|nr:hypothetical protein [Candidatus Krumholzibacteria bacterium]
MPFSSLPGRVSFKIHLAAVMLAACATALPAQERGEDLKSKLDAIGRTIVLDGSSVTTAGNLQMNVTNFGFLGSLPRSAYEMADVPSAQWPAGSGVEYLYAAGLWVGAQLDGIPSVSTGYPETEFYPSTDSIDRIYRATAGMEGGRTYPEAPDDDGDGLVNEDWLNGRDDDGDGLIDEDFEEIGTLMYSCWYVDDEAVAQKAWPEHTPLHVKVRQETYQWSESAYNNFVGVHYEISNQGTRFLESTYIGIYADLDAGPRNFPNYYRDDQIGSWAGIRCAPINGIEMPERISTVYIYDADGDEGRTPGYFGIVFLGARMNIKGMPNPITIDSPNAIRIFAGLLPFEDGGEPINDYQRYTVMSGYAMQGPTVTQNDYKILISAGPFSGPLPGAPIQLDIAFVAGEGLDGFLDNAAIAKLVYSGFWHDKDKNPVTGVLGRETLIIGDESTAADRLGIDPDPCDDVDEHVKLQKGDSLWTNADCTEEVTLWDYSCYKGNMKFANFRTGVNGREAQINWVASAVPPPPSMRAVAGDGEVSLIWDNLSEITPDPATMLIDFEGYQVWRADDWHRPRGTTTASGPSNELWHLIDSRDLVNGVDPDVDLEKPWSAGGFLYEPLQRMKNRASMLKAFEEILTYDPLGKVPCPPGITEAECDTFEAIARWNLGFEGGRRYYTYVDQSVKNGLPYFYSVVAYEPLYSNGKPKGIGRADSPYSNFIYVEPRSDAQEAERFDESDIYVVPNPATRESMAAWILEPNNADPSGEKVEFRNLPKCANTVRIFTVAGDLVQTLRHRGGSGNGTLAWNLVSRNGQTITSGIYIFCVDPDDGRFPRAVGKFVVIR